MGKYPDVFQRNSNMLITSHLFYKLYAQVCTRCYGSGLPSPAMIPMVDNVNHRDINVVSEIVNKDMHLIADRSSNYFTKTKYMNDFSLCFDEKMYASDDIKTKNV